MGDAVKTLSKHEKVQAIMDILDDLYPEIPVPLDHTDPYTLLVAVLLSAQCTDERVNQITPKLFAKADNPYDMVKMSIEEIQNIIRPCGLSPMKSKGIWHLSDPFRGNELGSLLCQVFFRPVVSGFYFSGADCFNNPVN